MEQNVGANVGQVAPPIDLPDGKGGRWKLADARGRIVVLLFYPGDETPVCTAQLCSVRDNWSRYQAFGADVVGINRNTEDDHRAFADHHKLPLTLLADMDGSVVAAYGMKMPLVNMVRRGVVVIDAQGVVRYRKVTLPVFRPDDDEILAAVQACQAG